MKAIDELRELVRDSSTLVHNVFVDKELLVRVIGEYAELREELRITQMLRATECLIGR